MYSVVFRRNILLIVLLNTTRWLISKLTVAFRKFANASSTRDLSVRYIVCIPQLVIQLKRLWTYYCLT
jgi:hypothetical protein